ncbi:MAG TPA: ABC transporter ATP-binding protein [Thermomicrobiales bacterium]|nr:ABC transporter ATP-binding protein [Thermomicrobiales bacterium]
MQATEWTNAEIRAANVTANVDAEAAVETIGLSKSYGGNAAVRDLSIRVAHGEVFGFLGPNGAGKTTSVKMLMGLVRPTSGRASLLGMPLGDREAKRHIGFLPELFRFHDWLTGHELLDLHGKLYGMSASARRRKIPETLQLVGLSNREGDRLRSYSKGMQQRIGLAQALLNDPRIVFLDEPTSALDPIGRLDVRRIIETLRAEGRTVFLNSHLLTEVEAVCDRVAIISNGRVVAMGSMADLLSGSIVIELRLGEWDDTIETLVRGYGSIEDIGHAENGRATVVLEVVDEEAIARLVHVLVSRHVAVYGVTPRSATLEELFIEVINRDGAVSVT